MNHFDWLLFLKLLVLGLVGFTAYGLLYWRARYGGLLPFLRPLCGLLGHSYRSDGGYDGTESTVGVYRCNVCGVYKYVDGDIRRIA